MVAEALTPGPTPTGPGAHARQGQGEGRYAGQRNLTLPVSFFKVQELPGTSTPGKRSVLPIFSKHERGGSVVWRHLRSILQLPFLVVVVVPTLILYFTDAINVGWSLAAPLNWMVTLAGGLVIGAGLLLVALTNALFARYGDGTLAPWDPTQKLVVRGVYRHVRNPMICGMMSILFGMGLWLGSEPLLFYAGVFAAINLIYIPLLEEPDLEARFGESYRLYKRHVPRWTPRLTPWTPPDDPPI